MNENICKPEPAEIPGGPPLNRDRQNIPPGLDLYPTICDYAGIEMPPHIEGYWRKGSS